MAKQQFDRTKDHVNVGTIGHVKEKSIDEHALTDTGFAANEHDPAAAFRGLVDQACKQHQFAVTLKNQVVSLPLD